MRKQSESHEWIAWQRQQDHRPVTAFPGNRSIRRRELFRQSADINAIAFFKSSAGICIADHRMG